MRCREAVARIDRGEHGETLLARLSLRLHLAFCQACRNYLAFSKLLGVYARKLSSIAGADAEKLNTKMMRAFAKEN